MPDQDLSRRRLLAQGLATRPFARGAEAVAAMGALQGQDLPGVIASAALRTAGGGVAGVVAELDSGAVVRGYPMRGTVFLVSAADARWIGQLCAGPALRAARGRQAALGLTDRHVDRAREAVLAALATEPRGLPRAEVMRVWESIGQPTSGGVGYHLLARLVSETLLFYGPWNGVDQNIVLADGWVPAGSGLEQRFNGDRVAAVGELLRRYLTSHGPATVRDFAWWTKLPLRQIRAALPLASDGLEHLGEGRDGTGESAYARPGLSGEVSEHADEIAAPRLLPGFDEFILGYPDRSFAMTEEQVQRLVPGRNGVFRRSLVVDGQVRGLWKRAGPAGRRRLELESFGRLSRSLESRLPGLFEDFPFTTG